MAEPSPLDPSVFLHENVVPRVERRITQLRADIAKLERELEDCLAAEATVQFVLEGDGGGVWYLNLREGQMRVSELPEAPPLICVTQPRGDWEALARVQVAAGEPPGTAATDLTRSRIERLRGIDGAIEFRLTGEPERRLRIQFGRAEPTEPRCVVSLAAVDFGRLQTRELTPQAAFMQGLVKVQGDMMFAMQLAAALLV